MTVTEVIEGVAPDGDTDAAIEFLERWHGDDPRIVITIDPETGTTKRHDFAPGEADRMRRVVDAAQGRLNCYTPVNIAAPGRTSPTKAEMRAPRALWIDADLKDCGDDPDALLAQLRSFEPPPAIITFSGGGYWALWPLAAPYDDGDDWRDQIERVVAGLHDAVGASPTCKNVNRLMRLPGTINLPNATKRARGRVPASAYIVKADWDRRLSFDAEPRLNRHEADGQQPQPNDRSRSGAAFRKGLAMRRAGQGFDEMCAALRADPETADWVREKGERSGGRELRRIWEKADRIVSAAPYRIDPKAPLATARLYRELRHDADDLPTLHHHRGGFYAWNGIAYPEVDDLEVRAGVYRFLDECVATVKDKGSDDRKQVPVKPATAMVNNVIDALRAEALVPVTIAAPAWLDGRTRPDPGELVACANGLLHLPTGELLPHTAAYFAHNAVDFTFDPDAPRPTAWLAFLGELWGDDAESIETLQEIFGYCLGADTSQQKAFLVVGPKRSGKGTIARVLTRLVGAENAVAPTLAGLGTNFGLAPLIGKRVAVISDARLGGRADQSVIAERLLSITGEDGVTIDRKYREAWTGRLGVRFLVLTNELPRLADASGALASRFIVLVLTESFFGREDPALTNRLLAELPGILNWAIVGWRRLRERGYFVQPRSAVGVIAELEDLGSPIGAFLRDRCDVGAGGSIEVGDLFDAWETWCLQQRRDRPGDKQSFGRDLRAAMPALVIKRHHVPGGVARCYEGIRLKDEVGPSAEEAKDLDERDLFERMVPV